MVAEAIEKYLEFLRVEDRAHKTLVKYSGVLRSFAAFAAERKTTRLDQVSLGLFDAYRALRKPKCHPKTMYLEGVILKQLFKWARSRKMVLENPIQDARLHKPILEPKAGPSLDEITAILQAASATMRPILATLAYTGMRSGELQRLLKEDIDLASNWIHIRSRIGAQTKTRTSRKVPIHPALHQFIETQLKRSSGPWLFTAAPSRQYPTGDHWISVKRLNETFVELVEKLGLPGGRPTGFTIHSLRHSFETITVHAGIPQRVIDTWLGHRNDKSMAAVYYRLADADSQKFMQEIPFRAVEANVQH